MLKFFAYLNLCQPMAQRGRQIEENKDTQTSLKQKNNFLISQPKHILLALK